MASGVCHSDWTYINGHYENDVMGHEGGGIVESVGEGVTTVKPGKYPGDIIRYYNYKTVRQCHIFPWDLRDSYASIEPKPS